MLSFLHKHLDKNAHELWDLAFQDTKWSRKEYHLPKRDTIHVLLTMTTCKRLDLFEQTVHSILHTWTDLDQVDAWFCVDDNSSEEDRQQMRSYTWIDYYMKNVMEKGHRKSMNIIWNKLQEVKPTYWIHIEDDFVFHVERSYVNDAIRGLQVTGASQIVYNRNYAETIHDYKIEGHIPVTDDFCLHEYKAGTFSFQNCHYWPHYSFRPGMTKVDVLLGLGNFDSSNTFFEMDYAYRWMNAGHKTAFFNAITCQHIGKLTKDKSKPNAYALNNCHQFHGSCIKVVNLERRKDRKEKMEEVLKGITYQFVKAVDGNSILPTTEISNLFIGNDFGNRKGVIGCALSHYQLWKQLVNDTVDYYIILEDDITVTNDFNEKLEKIKAEDICFLGYHMYSKDRDASYDEKDGFSIQPFQNDFYVGGTFGYYVTKKGAQKLLDHIAVHGIKHGIDYVMKIAQLNYLECKPHLVFSPWNEYYLVDSDIQGNFDTCELIPEDFIFIEGVDHINDDVERCEQNVVEKAKNENIVGFNSLGYLKSAINIHALRPSMFLKSTDGIYVKKGYHNLQKLIRVKMLCNWCTSVELCKQWSKMTEYNNTWKHIQMTSGDDFDYYVIINSTQEYYDPEKSFVYQMEPWVKDETKQWGVKVWNKWIEPNCLHLRGRKTPHLNTIQWLVEQTYDELKNMTIEKTKMLSTICSPKYWDEGHIMRIDMIHFFEKSGVSIDIYGQENTHHFRQYKGSLSDTEKSKGLLPYKYYFMIENSFEENYASEKIWEPILCETLCFYYGCTNLKDYIDERAFVQLDKTLEKSCDIVKKAMEEDWYTQRLPYIKAAKRDILNRLYFFPTLYTDIQRIKRQKITIPFKRICIIYTDDVKTFEFIYEKVIQRLYLFDHVIVQTTTPMKIIHPKVAIHHINSNVYELETINLIRTIVEYNEVELLYLSTRTIKKMKDLMNMILYFLLEKAEECILAFKQYDTIGCNLTTQYDGNCWWSKSSYLKTLSYLPIIDKKDAVEWLCMNHIGKHYEIHRSGINHAEYAYPSFLYQL
jgi:GR25 family glycosyltransferase involved in LPS biosynthesis